MTIGLTINQAGNDNQAFALKSSDVTTAYTTGQDTNTFYHIQKDQAAQGGAQIRVLQASAGVDSSLKYQVYGGTGNTTKSTSAASNIEFEAYDINGGSPQAQGANTTIFNIKSATATQWLVDAEGGTWQNGGATFNGDLVVADGNGLVVGHTALLATGSISELQVIGTTTADSSMSIQNFQADANAGALLVGMHSRGSVGAYTVLQDNDRIFTIRAMGADGGDADKPAGEIAFYVDGTPSDGSDMPGRIEFKTTPDGQGSSSTRMTIDNAGNVTKPSQPCFFATKGVAQTDHTGDATFATVSFGTEVFDYGDDLSTGHVFTAPVSGTYFFNTSVRVIGLTSSHTTGFLYFKSSNGSYQSWYGNPFAQGAPDGLGNFEVSMMGTMAIDMDASDTCYVQIYITGGGKTVDCVAGVGSWFGGHLIA